MREQRRWKWLCIWVRREGDVERLDEAYITNATKVIISNYELPLKCVSVREGGVSECHLRIIKWIWTCEFKCMQISSLTIVPGSKELTDSALRVCETHFFTWRALSYPKECWKGNKMFSFLISPNVVMYRNLLIINVSLQAKWRFRLLIYSRACPKL